MLLSHAVEKYLADRFGRGEIGAHTVKEFRYRLGTVLSAVGDLECADLSTAEVADWQRTVVGLGPATRRAMHSTLRGFCHWCLLEGIITQDPTLRLGRVRLPAAAPRSLTPGQLARLVAVLPDDRARAIVALQARLGLRCAEVSNLTVPDWDRDGRTLLVRGKFDNQRRLPVPDDVAHVLSVHLGERTGGPMIGLRPQDVSLQVSWWMTWAGLKRGPRDGVSAHALRRTAASDLYTKTRDLRLAQFLLGHKNVATTDRYLRPGDLDELRRALGS